MNSSSVQIILDNDKYLIKRDDDIIIIYRPPWIIPRIVTVAISNNTEVIKLPIVIEEKVSKVFSPISPRRLVQQDRLTLVAR